MGSLMLGRKTPDEMSTRQRRWLRYCRCVREKGEVRFVHGDETLHGIPANTWWDGDGNETIAAAAIMSPTAHDPLCITFFRNDGSIGAFEDKTTGDVFEFGPQLFGNVRPSRR